MSTTKTITVTLNPSLDETIIVNHLNLGYHNVTSDTMRLDVSGRGVNVSRALRLLDIQTHALVLLGNDAIGHAYKGLLNEQLFESTIVRYEGNTRSDTIIFDQSEDAETHIIDEAIGATSQSVEYVIDHLRKIVNDGDTVILAGKLPRSLHHDTYAQIAKVMDELKAHVVVMTGHETLDVTLQFEPELVILTRLELEAHFNYPVRTFEDMLYCSQKLLDDGAQQVITITDTFDEGLFVSDTEQFIIESNAEFSGTHSGVADSMVAGYLAGIQKGKSNEESFKLGMVAMLYAAEKIGNKFASMADLKEGVQQIFVRQIDSTASPS